MKKSIILFPLLLLTSALLSQKDLTLQDCFVYYKFYPQNGREFFYMNDEKHYAQLDKSGLHLYDISTGIQDSLLLIEIPEEIRRFDHFEFSDDETKILLRTKTESVYRHSVLAEYYIYDMKTKETIPVSEGNKLQFASFSPDGNFIAYVLDNNLFVNDMINNESLQITEDGKQNEIINGLPDWVYEEEFSPVDGEGMVACRWSPDSKSLAYIRFDEREVPEFPLTWYTGGMYPERSSFKYPKVGEHNSKVSVHLFDTETKNHVGEIMGLEEDDYIPRINFTADNDLIITRLNRRQDTLELLQALTYRVLYDDVDGKDYIPVKLLLQETDKAYVELEWESNLTFLEKDLDHYLWVSERSGFRHIYMLPMDRKSGEVPRPLTSGNFDVTAFYGVDEESGKFYYQTATPTPMDRQIWVGSLSGGEPTLLTPGQGTNEASFNPGFRYMQHSWSDANTPPVVTIRNAEGDSVRTITNNERVKKLRESYGLAQKEFFQFTLADGTVLNGWMIKPAVMDSTRKYPVLFDNYGGPGSQTVQNRYDGYMNTWQQLLVQKGYVIASVDNRGTGSRGRDFKKCTQLQLGKYETEDQIAAARYVSTLPWVDPARIGIWGWSFGGYLSTSCILKGRDVFKMAMAVAPVTNWKWYDTAYTERYMHTTTDNAEGYEQNSPVNFADLLYGDNYLICHGMADDNVHWQQTTEMINALIGANKQFETYYYPNRNHGIYGDNATMHLFRKLTDFVLEKL
ncbi:MAG: S9 family peptidase [Saprospiraceae bacterium]